MLDKLVEWFIKFVYGINGISFIIDEIGMYVVYLVVFRFVCLLR